MFKIWKMDKPLLLASGSVTRLNLLKSAAIPVEAAKPLVDERAIETSLKTRKLTPDLIALELAIAKGAEVSARYPDRLIVAADQTLALGEEQFHKPGSQEQARAQLKKLSGKTHDLHAAVVCFRDGQRCYAQIQSAHLTVRELGSDFLDAYLAEAGDAILNSVGGYQVEGLGVHLFKRIDGDHSTILGLPLPPLLAYFRSIGALAA